MKVQKSKRDLLDDYIAIDYYLNNNNKKNTQTQLFRLNCLNM